MRAAGVTVTPAANYQLSHQGVVAGPGENLTVPVDVADAWILHGLAEPAGRQVRGA